MRGKMACMELKIASSTRRSTHVPQMPDSATVAELAKGFKALGDETRVRLLALVAASDDGHVCVCDLTEAIGLSQSTVSHHLKILVNAGLLRRTQRGKWGYYVLVPGGVSALSQLLAEVSD